MDKIPVAGQKCPICGQTTDLKYKPFCSKRCADVDLNRWLSGVYRIETDETPEDMPSHSTDEE